MKKSPGPVNRVEVNARRRGLLGRRFALRAKRKLGQFFKRLGLRGVELSVALVSDAEMRRLNRTYRHKDKATDVLSFVTDERPSRISVGGFLGDLVVSLDTTRRVARERGVRPEDEFDRYLAHGLLHLLGHDHLRRTDAAKMATAEEALLGQTGLVPPPSLSTGSRRARGRTNVRWPRRGVV